MPMLFSKYENRMSPIQLRLNMGTQPHPTISSLRQNVTGTSAKSDGLTPFRHATLTYQKYFGFVLPKWCILVAAQLCDARPKS
jgi:hypothetical protein